jgi:hypothetical protein
VERNEHDISDRKNLERILNDRKKLAERAMKSLDYLEFDATETGRKWKGQHGTKFITESLNL